MEGQYTVIYIIENTTTFCSNQHFAVWKSLPLSDVGFQSYETDDILDFRSLIHELYCGISSYCVSLRGICEVGYELSRALSIYWGCIN